MYVTHCNLCSGGNFSTACLILSNFILVILETPSKTIELIFTSSSLIYVLIIFISLKAIIELSSALKESLIVCSLELFKVTKIGA
jgi:hypothetical protein